LARVPIVRLGNTLIVSVQDDLRDNDALDLMQNLGTMLENDGGLGVIIDLSIVETVDSFLGRMLGDLAQSTRLLGALTILVGMQPAVAITLVELGLELREIHTALNLDKGLRLLQRLLGEEDPLARRRI
jgi:rsbT antagonist protein RsbS